MSPVRKPLHEIPLKPNVFLVLMALKSEPMHGYALRQEVERLSDGQVRLDPGSLYRMIGRMLDDGLLDEVDVDDPEDERRRYYDLTRVGRETFEAELSRMSALVHHASGDA